METKNMHRRQHPNTPAFSGCGNALCRSELCLSNELFEEGFDGPSWPRGSGLRRKSPWSIDGGIRAGLESHGY